MAMNKQETTEEFLETVFSIQSDLSCQQQCESVESRVVLTDESTVQVSSEESKSRVWVQIH
jgi:hypothetical protein